MIISALRARLCLLLYFLSARVWAFAPYLPNRLLTVRLSRIHTATNSGVGEADLNFVPKGERNFYEILGASPNATKMELKQSYIQMARVTHPDALIGANKTEGGDTSTSFSEIAQAWKVLSNDKDRRRYDRSLVAEGFKKNVEKVATNVVETAGPRVKKAFDDFAMPFLRRTTVTTVASVSAAVDVLGNGDKMDLGSAVVSGMKAARAAGQVIDGIEFREKSLELDERAAKEISKVEKISAELNKLIEKRLNISLVTPNSGLTATEARQLLNTLNATEPFSIMERMVLMKHNIERDIKDLESLETEYFAKVANQADAAENLRFTQVALKQAARDAKQAVLDEIKARKAWEEAQKRVTATKLNVNDLSKSFGKVQALEAKVTNEVEIVTELVARRREFVRTSLRKKELEIENERRRREGESTQNTPNVPILEETGLIEVIDALREEEFLLQTEKNRLSETVARLLSRSEKLKSRAAQMDEAKGKG